MVEAIVENKPEIEQPQPEKVAIDQEPPAIVSFPAPTVEMPIVEPEEPQKKPKKKRIHKTAMNVDIQMQGETLHLFRETLKMLSKIADEIPIQFNKDNITIRSMDPSRVAMANIVFEKADCHVFDVENKTRMDDTPLPATICVHLEDLLYCFDKSVTKEATVKFKLQLVYGSERITEEKTVYKPEKCPTCGMETNSNNNILAFKIREKHPRRYKCRKCEWKGNVSSHKKNVKTWSTELLSESVFNIEVVDDGSNDIYEVAMLEPNKEEVPLPKIAFEASIKIVTKKLKTKLEKFKVKVDHVHVTGSAEGLIIDGSSDTTVKSLHATWLRGSEYLLDAHGYKQIANYSLSYFPEFLIDKPTMVPSVLLEFSTDMPFRIKWETNLKNVLIEWFLAPRVEQD